MPHSLRAGADRVVLAIAIGSSRRDALKIARHFSAGMS